VCRIVAALLAVAGASLHAGYTAAAEIRVLALQSPQIAINAVGAAFEQDTGHKITQLLRRTDMPPEAKKKIDSG